MASDDTLLTRARVFAGSATFATLGLRCASVVLAFVSMLLLGRTLGNAGYGIFAGTISIANFGAFLARLGVEAQQVRNIPTYSRGNRHDHVAGTLLFGALTTLLFCGAPMTLIWLVRAADPALFGPFTATAMVASAMIPPMAMASFAQGALRGFMRYVIAFLPSFVLLHVIHLAIIAVLLIQDALTPSSALLSMTTAWYLSAIVALLMLWGTIPGAVKKARPSYRPGPWLKASAFTALGMVNIVFIGQADVFLIGLLGSAADAGVYAAGQRVSWLLMMPVMAVYGGLSPTVAALYAERSWLKLSDRVRAGARETLGLALLIALPLTVAGPWLFELFGPGFAQSYPIYLVLAAGLLSSLLFGRAFEILIMTGHAGLAGCVSFGAIVLNAVADVLLIPAYGAMGAAVATATILPLEALILCVLAWRHLQIRCDIAVLRGNASS